MEEIRYKELINSVSDWVWAVDINGIYTYCSENVYDFLGFRANEVIGKTPFDFMSEKEAQRVGKIFTSFASQNKPITHLENTHIHKNGFEIVVETNAIPILDEFGNLFAYQGLDKDITEQVRLKEELQQKNQQILEQSKIAVLEMEEKNKNIEYLLDATMEAIVISNKDSIIIQANQTSATLFKEKDKSTLLGKNITQYLPEYELPKLQESLQYAYDEPREYDLKKSDGTIFPTLASGRDILMNGEKVRVSIVLDLTEVKLQEKRVKEEVEKNRLQDKLMLEQSRVAQEKLNTSLTILNENVISSTSDINGIITEVSQALCDISGYDEEELIGKNNRAILYSDTNSNIFEEILNLLKSGKTWKGDLKNYKKDGSNYWVTVSVIPNFDKENNLISYTSIRNDMTAQKVKEEFMANMSHELRTPLNAIIGFSGILNKKQTDSHHKELSDQINSSSKSLLSLINDILDLSKIQDSSFTIEPFAFNAYEEIVDFSYQFEGLTDKKTLVFKNSISANLKNIFLGDWQRISQVMLNLISNAVKFTPKDGEIIFDVDYKDKSIVISVIDNGVGMNKEVQDKIFKPFEQADGSTTRKYGGTGLGLNITQNLVELMNGKIELDSQEGQGSTFKVTIPLQMIEPTEEAIVKIEFSEDEKEDSLEGHILIVEDNKTNQMLVRMLIEDFGLTSEIANDGIEAVEIYNPDIHKLILMDENMPNMNGIEAMKILKEKYQDKCGTIIALTANAMEGDREKFLSLGMDGYISKPIDGDELYRILKEFL